MIVENSLLETGFFLSKEQFDRSWSLTLDTQ